MIHINRVSRPEELTDGKVQELTQRYKVNKKSVWNKEYIKRTLLEMTHNKCCYCEAPLNEQGAYMEVEHFHPKALYPDEVLSWNNLLPVCKTCNVNKSNFDTKKKGFIDPTLVNPKDYFLTKNYMYFPKNENPMAENTIDQLKLNSLNTLALSRAKIGIEVSNKIATLLKSVKRHQLDPDELNADIGELREILKLVQPNNNYSAVISSVLLNNQNYKLIKDIFIKSENWDANLIELEESAKAIAFDEE